MAQTVPLSDVVTRLNELSNSTNNDAIVKKVTEQLTEWADDELESYKGIFDSSEIADFRKELVDKCLEQLNEDIKKGIVSESKLEAVFDNVIEDILPDDIKDERLRENLDTMIDSIISNNLPDDEDYPHMNKEMYRRMYFIENDAKSIMKERVSNSRYSLEEITEDILDEFWREILRDYEHGYYD